MRRRDVLIAATAGTVVLGLPPLVRSLQPLKTEPVPGLAGFRRLVQGMPPGAVSIAVMGVDAPDPDLTAAVAAVREDPERLLRRDGAGGASSAVPLSLFTDAFCPVCASLEHWLLPAAASDPAVSLALRPLPLLGPASDRAARAALAGRLLGAEGAVWPLVRGRSLRPGPGALRTLAEQAGLDPAAFADRYASAEVDRLLLESRAEADALGIVGTPALLVGRTLAIGALPRKTYRRLVALEQREAGA